MYKYPNFAIVISFFSLWLNLYLSENHQLILGFFLIFTFGILHGANDLVLIKTLNKTQKAIPFIKILTYYIVIVSFGIMLFYLIPIFALFLFIIVSGYHFGEQQWQILESLKISWFKIFFQTIYGIFILFLLFNFHQIEVQNIVRQITLLTYPFN